MWWQPRSLRGTALVCPHERVLCARVVDAEILHEDVDGQLELDLSRADVPVAGGRVRELVPRRLAANDKRFL